MACPSESGFHYSYTPFEKTIHICSSFLLYEGCIKVKSPPHALSVFSIWPYHIYFQSHAKHSISRNSLALLCHHYKVPRAQPIYIIRHSQLACAVWFLIISSEPSTSKSNLRAIFSVISQFSQFSHSIRQDDFLQKSKLRSLHSVYHWFNRKLCQKTSPAGPTRYGDYIGRPHRGENLHNI